MNTQNTVEITKTPASMIPAIVNSGSAIGADNINYDAEVRVVGMGKEVSKYGHTLQGCELSSAKLITRTMAVVKSKRGLGELRLPADVAEKISIAVHKFCMGRANSVLAQGKAKYRQSVAFKLTDETNPVQVKHTIVSYETVSISAQDGILFARMTEVKKKAERAEELSNPERADKLMLQYESLEMARANLGDARMKAELALSK